MDEAFVRVYCPACPKSPEENLAELPAPDEPFDCPGCDERRTAAEFVRTPATSKP